MELSEVVLAEALSSEKYFVKFISANEAGKTGSHQCGFYIPKEAWEMFFDREGEKGENKYNIIKIKWQDDFETESRIIYYGKETRNEYRITRFGRNFPFFADEYIGSLLVIIKKDFDYYHGFVLDNGEDIEKFFQTTGLPIEEMYSYVRNNYVDENLDNKKQFEDYLESLKKPFPETREISEKAREFCSKKIKDNDEKLIQWLDKEYELFRYIESVRYDKIINNKIGSIEELIRTANTILQRRKSRAGKSLENHFSKMLEENRIPYTSQANTEGSKKADFIFPNIDSYHKQSFPEEKLFFLGAKTTCKDRWRQILNEADRIKTKHLLTLQQGISSNQLDEMSGAGVKLVVPKKYISLYPKPYQNRILKVNDFLDLLKNIYSNK
ncbi:MAG TPA: type II restriction endonuclease [Caldisericia bacterium]|jgi:type II restriction enzyme|nr:type II restriction endonuclease [Caldisericia bacterium]HNY61995.1 type II restriction endonuclease [Caldisericia bacterium]HOC79959.1 type II restriction endonuclease [Caldisericia bacterium]HOG71086.1 type II restriction endonuclease [Caldisericia bacterium]HPM44802.1 type II restriction endonuclease [Caldisericia bacterium]